MMRTLLLAVLLPCAASFVAPIGLTRQRETMQPSYVLSSDELLPEAVAAAVSNEASGLMGTVTTILTGLTAVAFFLFGLTYITAAWIIPKAAEKVEEEAAVVCPELLVEYRAKLKQGETFAMRPDLLQELAKQVEELGKTAAVLSKDDERGDDLKSASPTDQTTE